jgi:hypothetical protein
MSVRTMNKMPRSVVLSFFVVAAIFAVLTIRDPETFLPVAGLVVFSTAFTRILWWFLDEQIK